MSASAVPCHMLSHPDLPFQFSPSQPLHLQNVLNPRDTPPSYRPWTISLPRCWPASSMVPPRSLRRLDLPAHQHPCRSPNRNLPRRRRRWAYEVASRQSESGRAYRTVLLRSERCLGPATRFAPVLSCVIEQAPPASYPNRRQCRLRCPNHPRRQGARLCAAAEL